MRFFPLIFTSVIVGLHLYVFLNLRRAFGGGWWQLPVAIVFLLGMYSIYFRGRSAPDWVNHATYLWIGLIIILADVFLFRELFAGIAWFHDRVAGGGWHRLLASPGLFRMTFVLALVAYGWSLFEAAHPVIRRVRVVTDRLPDGVDSVRMVLMADIHITPWTSAAALRRIVDMSNREDPDIVVMAGDYVDGRYDPAGWQAVELRHLTHRFGKVAVLGNHELYSGREPSIQFIRGAGFNLLRGDAVRAGPIVVAGVDDPQVGGRVEIPDALDEAAALDPDAFRLLVSHRPESPEAAIGRFDLAVSGHTHGGQIWPVRYIVRLMNGFPQGMTVLPAPAGRERVESRQYVTNGTRFWGPPVRFLTPAEMTVIDLVAEP
ncbi:MAG: metallophosphoesterase [Planctomycetes bacterium]|nr:metallophosphoesterase [Planctomycetota bacterium]